MGISIGILAVSARILYQLFALPSESKLIDNHEKIHQNHTTKVVENQSEKVHIWKLRHKFEVPYLNKFDLLVTYRQHIQIGQLPSAEPLALCKRIQ